MKGSVLLDFSNGAARWTQSGYQICDIVLTAAAPTFSRFFNNLINRTNGFSDISSLKITCYQTDGSKLRVDKNGKIRNIWTCTRINEIISDISKSNMGPFALNTKYNNAQVNFMLIDFSNSPGGSNNINTLLDQLSKYSKNSNLYHGQNVYTVYTPFGVNEFMKSCSRGCLSNTFKDILFLIDGRLAPGCEGAPVYTKANERDQEYPIGLVLFPIAMGTDHSSYSLVTPVHTVITMLLESKCFLQPPMKSSTFSSPLGKNIQLQDAVSNSVIVQTSAGWGSGIVIGPGLVMTNSHVIGFGTKTYNQVLVNWKNHAVAAKVVFHSNPSSVLDIALLEYNKAFGPTGITFSSNPIEKGDSVIAIGHPLHSLHMPSISKGIILNCYEGSVGFTTSCIINAGSSGGSIVQEDGTLIGIVVGIIKAGSFPYPEMNICISATIFESALHMYQSYGDIELWNELVCYDDSWLRALRILQKCKY